MPRAKKSAKPADKKPAEKKKQNKSEFIRGHPDKKPAEIVELAKAQGLELTVEYVYAIRQNAKKAAKKGTANGLLPKGKPGPKPKIKVSTDERTFQHFKARLKEMIFHIGYDHVREMLNEIHIEIVGTPFGREVGL